MGRSHETITGDTLQFLRNLAEREFEAFFERNSESMEYYRDRYMGACLCQGAAWHYVGKGDGVKDFDVHLFFWQHPDRHIVSRVPKAYQENVPNFGRTRCDVLKTVVPESYREASWSLQGVLKQFLEDEPTRNAHHLAKKAVVGLDPGSVFKEVIWE